jgi:hypothetical protein
LSVVNDVLYWRSVRASTPAGQKTVEVSKKHVRWRSNPAVTRARPGRGVSAYIPRRAFTFNASKPRRYSQRGRSRSPPGQELGRLRDLRGFARAAIARSPSSFSTSIDSRRRIGHFLADLILFQVARRLEQSIRPEDVAARFGGDEFGFCRVKDFSPENALIREAKALIRQGSHRSSKTRFWQKMP